jgi:hypothetical protein
VIVALSTIVFGGVVINVANNKCNSMLMRTLTYGNCGSVQLTDRHHDLL